MSAQGSGHARSSGQTARLELLTPPASPEEAAAIVAALEQFMRATAARPADVAGTPDRWREAALLEGVERDPHEPLMHPWIDATPYV